MKRETICLIGGNGFLGTFFRQTYHRQFKKILILGRNMRVEGLRENEVYHSIATLSIDRVAAIIKSHNVSTIVDFSYNTVPKSSFENPISDFSENLYMTIHHLEIARCVSGVRFFYISSGGTVYGNVDKRSPLDENHTNIPLSPYGITKLTGERYALMYQQIYGLDIVVLRPSNIYGPGQKPFRGQGFIATAIACSVLGKSIQIFGDGKHVRDYLYIDDFCQALWGLLDKGINGTVYNIGNGEGFTVQQVVEIMATFPELGTPIIEYLPERPFDVRYNVLNRQRISDLLKWSPQTSLKQGIRESANWLLPQLQPKLV